ncbi:MAG: S8 family serine peptidase, partial [Lewinella sp.]|nr:S8 family serine peptidase [Lewinella sp.]
MNVSAQHDQILIKFKSGATALDIQSLMNEISAQPLDFSGLSGVHKWQLPSQYPITTMFGTTLYSPLDILELTVGKAIVQGVDLNYQGGPNPYGTSFYGNYFNLPDYNPLYDCSAYPGHILASGLGDKHVRIAIIDTGIDDENMPDLFGSRIASSYDFIEDKPSSVIDENGHGTQVAGIITGMAYVSDLYNVDLLELKALDGSGSGDLYDIIEAIEYAVENGANIINCSFGYSPLNGDHYSNLFHQVLEEASSHGILIIAASGNDNNDLDNIKYYPGSYTDIPNLIKVGASKCDGSTTSFGSFGYQSVELAGPGVHILCPSINGRWLYKEGTSFAAPIVTGVAMQFASTMSSFNAG